MRDRPFLFLADRMEVIPLAALALHLLVGTRLLEGDRLETAPWESLVLVPGAWFVLVIAHHHAHAPLFRPAWLNLPLTWILAALTGRSPAAWRLAHRAGHHGLRGTTHDPSATPAHPGRLDLFSHGARVAIHESKLLRGDVSMRIRRPATWADLASDWIPLLALRAAFVFWNPLAAILLLILPSALAGALWRVASYFAHAGTDGRALQVRGRLANALTLSALRHEDHHRHPDARWCRLGPATSGEPRLLPFLIRRFWRGFRVGDP